MSENGHAIVEKKRILVWIKLDDGERYKGHIFAESTDRALDLLNTEKRFIPFQTGEMTMMIPVAKIIYVQPREAEQEENEND